MSVDPASQDADRDARSGARSGAREVPWAQRLRWFVLTGWLAVCAWAGVAVAADGAPTGDLHGLISAEHRPDPTEVLVMISLDRQAPGGDTANVDELLTAVDRVHRELGSAWVPIAPPAVEVQGWLDIHALLFLELSEHDELRDRLTDDAMSAAVTGLRARLSSPLFGLTHEEPRRDPLQLRELTATARRFGPDGARTPGGATATPNGDLLAASRDAVVLQLRAEHERAAPELARRVADVVSDGPWAVELLGPQREAIEAAAAVRQRTGRLVAIVLAAIGLVLALALRRVRAVLALLATVGSAVAVAWALRPAPDPLSVPLLVLLGGFGCELAPHVRPLSRRAWPAATLLGVALVPLWLSPYPLWKQWALTWLVAVAVVAIALRLVFPALLSALGATTDWGARRTLLRPSPAIAVVLTLGILGVGAWSAEAIEIDGPADTDLGPAIAVPAQERLVREFFDPALQARSEVVGADTTDALLAAADQAEALTSVVPQGLVSVDSPGNLVLAPTDIEQRRASLSQLDLPGRLAKLEAMLENQGFRPAAFGESLRNALDERSAPTPEALRGGPLGRWVARYLEETPDGVVARTLVQFPADRAVPLPVVVDDEGRRIEMRGEVVASRTDRKHFKDWLGVYLVCQLWIGALVVWLGTRSFAVSMSATVAALVTQSAVISMLVALHQPLGPVIIPPLLLVGAAAMITAARACRATELRRPVFAMGLLTTSACQVAAGLSLAATDLVAWTQIGLTVALGAAVASGVGIFVAPGVARLLRSVRPGRNPPTPDPRPGTGDPS